MREITQEWEYKHCLAWSDLYVKSLWHLLSTPIDYTNTQERRGTRIASIRRVLQALQQLREACEEYEKENANGIYKVPED